MVADVEVRALTPATFPDLAALFAGPGGPRHCWCRVFRAPVDGMNQGTPAEKQVVRRYALAAEVAAGARVGMVASAAGVPAGCFSCGPQEVFVRLGTEPVPVGEVWSVVCFFVPQARRGQGIARALLAGAVAAAREAGAAVLEAYPVDPESPSYRFMGFVPFFAAQGFAETGRIGTRRHVMRRDLRA